MHQATANPTQVLPTLSLDLRRFRLAPCLCHLGSQRSGSGRGPGLAGSTPWGSLSLCFFRGLAAGGWPVSMGAAALRLAEVPAKHAAVIFFPFFFCPGLSRWRVVIGT